MSKELVDVLAEALRKVHRMSYIAPQPVVRESKRYYCWCAPGHYPVPPSIAALHEWCRVEENHEPRCREARAAWRRYNEES